MFVASFQSIAGFAGSDARASRRTCKGSERGRPDEHPVCDPERRRLPVGSESARVPNGPKYYSVKESVFPFIKFPGADPILGPEMKSTGEVMGVGRTFGEAYAKAQLASGVVLPRQGAALLSVRDRDKDAAVELAKILLEQGFDVVATHGTAQKLATAGVSCRRVNKVREGRPHIVDMIKNGEIDLIVNTTEGKQAINESTSIRAEAVRRGVTYYTTLNAAIATCKAIEHLDDGDVNRLQDLHNEVAA